MLGCRVVRRCAVAGTAVLLVEPTLENRMLFDCLIFRQAQQYFYFVIVVIRLANSM